MNSTDEFSKHTPGVETDPAHDFDALSLFTEKWRQSVSDIPEFYKSIGEMELQEELGPTPVEWALRRRYGDIIKLAESQGQESVDLKKLYEGICSRPHFYTKVMSVPLKVAWIIRPIVDHTSMYDAIHQESLRKIFDFVRMTPITEKNLPQFLKIADRSADRVHGAVAQKIQMNTKNLNVDVSASQLPQGPEGQIDLEGRVAELQRNLLNGPRDVTPEKDI